MQETIQFSTKPIWDTVIQIRKQIKSNLESKGYEPEIVEASEIVSMELLENAVKYGTCTEECSSVDLTIDINEKEKEIKIKVCNGIVSKESVSFLLHLIDTLKASDNIELLYMNRLEEIMSNPKSGKSQLGLYRIAYETNYRLDYNVSEKKLEMIAVRRG